MDIPPNADNDLKMESLLRAAIPEVLAHQDAGRFLDWMRRHIADYLPSPMREEATPALFDAMAYSLGRGLWNSLPLPRNGYRPETLPEPGRNDPCPCGSGHKFKHCCLQLPRMPVETELIWPVVLESMNKTQREEALRSAALPRRAIVALARQQFEEQRFKQTAKLLEPLLLPQPVAHDEILEEAFDLYCDICDRLDWVHKKTGLIETVISKTPRSPLRSGAWQRRVLIAMDRNDLAAAREALRKAQRDDPDAPELAVLEVDLLLAEHRPEHARERAEFFVRRMRRHGYPEDEPPLNFLLRIARDPVGALSDIALERVGETGRGLLDWIGTVTERPVPAYEIGNLNEQSAESDADIVERLVQLGISRREAQREVEKLPPLDLDGSAPEQDAAPAYCLLATPGLAELERAWHTRFPLGKPFATHNEPLADADAWSAEAERLWTAFLHKHPECFDSLDILDDLATAAMQHPQSGLPSLNQGMLLPLLRRTQAIVAHAVKGDPAIVLPWGWADNRPMLRNLARLAMVLQPAQPEQALETAETLLALNPNDNHGFRCLVINALLERGENDKAVELADRYPDDIMAEVTYGRALALFRLGHKKTAEHCLRTAIEDLPKVATALVRNKLRRPEFSEYGVAYGGDDEAWLYRKAMLSTWAATPGALNWLRTIRTNTRRTQGNRSKPGARRK